MGGNDTTRLNALERRVAALEMALSVRAPLCYVTPAGVVTLPLRVRELLGVVAGGGVAFVEDKGRIVVLSDEALAAELGDPEDGSERV